MRVAKEVQPCDRRLWVLSSNRWAPPVVNPSDIFAHLAKNEGAEEVTQRNM